MCHLFISIYYSFQIVELYKHYNKVTKENEFRSYSFITSKKKNKHCPADGYSQGIYRPAHLNKWPDVARICNLVSYSCARCNSRWNLKSMKVWHINCINRLIVNRPRSPEFWKIRERRCKINYKWKEILNEWPNHHILKYWIHIDILKHIEIWNIAILKSRTNQKSKQLLLS